MKRGSISSILLIYLVASLAVLALWTKSDWNRVTGDEPHYLVMAKGIGKYGSLEQTLPYREEFEKDEISKFGLGPYGAEPTPENAPVIAGPHGLFNVHNIGLPLLLALPFMVGGIVGSKIFMVCSGAMVLLIVWKMAKLFSDDPKWRYWSVIAACLSLPLIPASTQIYPEVLAGLISLVGLYWYSTTESRRAEVAELAFAGTVAFLPWLHIKFAPTCVILVLAVATKIFIESRNLRRAIEVVSIAGIACAALGAYNYYAFGRVSGPYQSGALELSQTSLMVLLGLHLDQNQGFLLQNPINLVGIMALGALYRSNRSFTLLWALVFLSLIVPNAMHPNWYGGGSFSGRFGWSAAIVFSISTIYGLLLLARAKAKVFHVAVGVGVSLQLYLFYRYAIEGVDLYNKGGSTLSNSYSIYYSPIHTWLPMLYDSTWAYSYMPNYVWLVFVSSIFALGLSQGNRLRNIIPCTRKHSPPYDPG